MNKLYLTNTLSGKKELFVPLTPNIVKMYVCGITPYDDPHVGHGRVYVTFDILYRLLSLLDYKVTYCRNFTDIDDKLLNKAQAEFNDQMRYKEIAQRYIKSFDENMQQLNCLKPTYEPRVTETIPEIIKIIQALIDNGKAYVINGDVYYEINKFKDYCKLSKRKLEDLKAGARVEVDEHKRNPLDFALWKSEPEFMFWDSPWGWGRPGWHIECSAMAEKFLGEHIDIHGGGMDLIFPHHENEVAQSEGVFGEPFAKYWIHNAFVRINKEKMSKSLGNFFTLKDVFKKFDPMVIRFYYINHNYNIPLDFDFEEIERTQKSYQRLCKIFESPFVPLRYALQATQDKLQTVDDNIDSSMVVKRMLDSLCQDLNTAGVMGVVFENIKLIEENKEEAEAVKYFLQNILGLRLIPLKEKEVEITPEIQKLIEAREEARKVKDWAFADELRDKLHELGYDTKDKKI